MLTSPTIGIRENYYSYYAEEKTLAAPKPASAATIKKPPVSSSNTKMGGADKIYGRELREFDDKDIESLLSNLTTEELEDLNNDFDPDVSLFQLSVI